MEYYMLLVTDADDVYKAQMITRFIYLKRLEALKTEGRLPTAGPNPLSDNPGRILGNLIIAQFESLDAAQQWAERGPYVDAGVYEELLVKSSKIVFK